MNQEIAAMIEDIEMRKEKVKKECLGLIEYVLWLNGEITLSKPVDVHCWNRGFDIKVQKVVRMKDGYGQLRAFIVGTSTTVYGGIVQATEFLSYITSYEDLVKIIQNV